MNRSNMYNFWFKCLKNAGTCLSPDPLPSSQDVDTKWGRFYYEENVQQPWWWQSSRSEGLWMREWPHGTEVLSSLEYLLLQDLYTGEQNKLLSCLNYKALRSVCINSLTYKPNDIFFELNVGSDTIPTTTINQNISHLLSTSFVLGIVLGVLNLWVHLHLKTTQWYIYET